MVQYVPEPVIGKASKPETGGVHIALNKFFGSLDPDGKTYLGDPEQVEMILRAFIADVMARRAIQHTPESWEEAKALDRDAIERLVNIFLGRDDAFETIGSWNVDSSLPMWCARTLGIKWDGAKDDELVMKDTFAGLMLEVLQEIDRDGDDIPDEDWQAAVDDAIQKWTHMLLGIPEMPEPPTLGELAADLLEDEGRATE